MRRKFQQGNVVVKHTKFLGIDILVRSVISAGDCGIALFKINYGELYHEKTFA
jgi:hypothetical protein